MIDPLSHRRTWYLLGAKNRSETLKKSHLREWSRKMHGIAWLGFSNVLGFQILVSFELKIPARFYVSLCGTIRTVLADPFHIAGCQRRKQTRLYSPTPPGRIRRSAWYQRGHFVVRVRSDQKVPRDSGFLWPSQCIKCQLQNEPSAKL